MSDPRLNSKNQNTPSPAQSGAGNEDDDLTVAKEVAKVRKQVWNDFFEKRGRYRGKLLQQRLQSMLVAYTAKTIPMLFDDVGNLTSDDVLCDERFSEFFDNHLINLDGKVVTSKSDSGSPYVPPSHRRSIVELALSRIKAKPKPPPVIKRAGDPKAYLTELKGMLPNVADASAAANGFREFIENVHASISTPGAVFTQRVLWLLSREVGGVGKTFLLDRIKGATDKLGISSGFYNFDSEHRYTSKIFTSQIVTLSDETPPFDKEAARMLNPAFDQKMYHYDEKWGACGMAKSVTNFVFGSNYVPNHPNRRRYAIVPFLTIDLETISDEQRAHFAYWDEPDEFEAAIIRLFETAPFKSEHPAWRSPSSVPSEDSAAIRVPGFYADVLEGIKEAVAHIGKADEKDRWAHLKPRLTAMRPSVMVKVIADLTDLDEDEIRATKRTLLSLLQTLHDRRLLGYKGRLSLWAAQLNWTVFEKVVAGGDPATETTDPFAATAAQWDALITAEQ